eukprot:CAMPEP_0194298274 /NCGR_PEP_ID=MMETSP0169-20130528/60074_1 /TAXON_ID=218684 /ORGANISM="Corethron pennatum, Strain L29A3" /LENGTH=389 /DNA_ID=CAMNT_0039048241 /DNA_START=481 /DNA_END=1647 /DNA_ORIENTATION=-
MTIISMQKSEQKNFSSNIFWKHGLRIGVASFLIVVMGFSIHNGSLDTTIEIPVPSFKSADTKEIFLKQQTANGKIGTTEALIKPPFRIVQVGEPRSGSTFQFRLLGAIANLKSPTGNKVLTQFVTPNPSLFEKIIKNNLSFVLKTHKEFKSLAKLQRQGDISVFSSTYSSSLPSYAVYTQKRNQLVISSMREIERYRPIFGLTTDEVNTLKEYMGDYEKIRQCCGMQMSKYEVLRLNGCDISKFIDEPDYPMCEKNDMPKIERRFHANPIPYEETSEKNWAKPGDCARFNLEISSGKGFNGRQFDKCEINGMFAGKGSSDGSFLWEEEKKNITNEKKKPNNFAETKPSPELPPKKLPVTKTARQSNQVIKPPFRIVQIGEPRSGSTFQF